MKKAVFLLAILTLVFSLVAGCGKGNENTNEGNKKTPSTETPVTTAPTEEKVELSGDITIVGSSTVYPITIIAAEEFMDQNPKVNIAVASTGTGGGFKKWVIGEADINNASSRIKEKQIAEATKNNINPIELTVAYDGITVVVNKDNDFVDFLTMDELKKIWEPESTVKTWADVREGWPNEIIKLYGPGTDSGTFEFFTEKAVGTAKSSRTDYSPSEDDNVLVQGVAGDKYSLGYFGFAYYVENQDRLKAIPISKDGNPAVEPTMETIEDGSYKPFSREIWIYVSDVAVKRPEVAEFAKFYLDHAAQFAAEAGYIPLSEENYNKEKEEIAGYLK